MRNRNSIQFMTLVIIFSILTVFSEFLLLYLLKKDQIAVGISFLIVLLVSVVLLFLSHNYEALFIYMLLNVVLSSILAAYSFWEIRYFYYSVNNFELWTVCINLLIPCIVSFLCDLLIPSDNLLNYKTFYRNSSILFSFFYIVVFIYIEFLSDSSLIQGVNTTNYIPFYTIAGYIEDYIYKVGTFKAIILPILVPAILFLPFGYFLALLLRHGHRILRLVLLLIMPTIIELLQLTFSINVFNMDNLIFGFLGGLIGELIYLLVNGLYLLIKGREFLETDSAYRSSLHF